MEYYLHALVLECEDMNSSDCIHVPSAYPQGWNLEVTAKRVQYLGFVGTYQLDIAYALAVL